MNSLPTHKFFWKGDVKLLLPVSEIPMKLRFCSFVKFEINLCFFWFLNPSLLHKNSFHYDFILLFLLTVFFLDLEPEAIRNSLLHSPKSITFSIISLHNWLSNNLSNSSSYSSSYNSCSRTSNFLSLKIFSSLVDGPPFNFCNEAFILTLSCPK
jgi:hypothetical protein